MKRRSLYCIGLNTNKRETAPFGLIYGHMGGKIRSLELMSSFDVYVFE